ncbi:type III-B CRISPR module-associated Cmr3 family protein [Myxococcus sp. MxC21-1]|uniref:type III-B CRISPR module-associated Cmr3 family protein n=1 Tax=Myxococcus sp. MxC21-1 TaxID=3041439 RepID=UPI002931F43A|nr:type III-B CRISPR module-associated Cmr3 family protein [Myxococcus sp. MxC21-1]WNZ62075.1 type III-B CRISPR module-associated Cmr3 family protein [Myxococcus sp. MxC21-1]
MLHSREVVELLRLQRHSGRTPVLEEWALGLSCAWPAPASGAPRGPLGLGGRRRLSAVEPLKVDLFAITDGVARATRGLRLVLATPAEFQRGWLPDGFERVAGTPPRYVGRLPCIDAPVVLRAALVPRPLDVSGWDMVRRRPRPTRRWVPAGAVYFFEKHSGGDFTANELRALWLASWGGGHAEALGSAARRVATAPSRTRSLSMESRPYLLHALSPLHVGTGQSVGVIDLPLARLKATGIPFVPGSSLKGVLRELRRPREETGDARGLHDAVFGPRRAKAGPEGTSRGTTRARWWWGTHGCSRCRCAASWAPSRW